MPRLALARGYSTQPQQAAKADHANSLTKALVSLTNFGVAHPLGRAWDAVTNTPWTQNGTTASTVTNKGRGVVINGDTVAGSLSNAGFTPSTKITGPWTVLMLASCTNNADTGVYLASAAAAPYCANFTGTWSISNTANGSVSSNSTIQAVVFRQTATVGDVTVNGIKGTGNAQNYAAWSAGSAVLGDFGVGGGFEIQGSIVLCAVWNRALTDNEIRKLTANPWQLFRAPASPLEKSLNVAASVYGVSVAEVLSAVDVPNRDGGATYNVTQAEAGTAADTPASALSTTLAITESGTAADVTLIPGPPGVTVKQMWLQNVGEGNPATLKFGANPMSITQGSTILALTSGADLGTLPGPTDSAGTFVLPTNGRQEADGSDRIWALIQHQVNAAGGNHTITPGTVGSGAGGEICHLILEVTNMPATATIRSNAAYGLTGISTSQNWSLTSGTEPVAGDLAVVISTYENTVVYNPSDLSDPPSGGWTSLGHAVQTGDIFIPTTFAYQIVPSDGALTASYTTSDPHVSEHLVVMLVMAPLTAGGGGATYNVTASESGTAADASSAIETANVTQAEAGTALDAPSASWTTGAALTEVGTAVDAPSAGKATPAAVVEAGTAADSAAGALATSQTVAEAGTAADTPGASLAASATVAEAGTSLDAPSAAQSAAVAIVEAGTAADTSSTSAAGVLIIAEGGAVVDTQAGTLVTTQATAEAGTVADVVSVAMVAATSIAEASTALDAPNAAASVTYVIAEALTAADTLSQIGGAIVLLVETLTALDAPTAHSALAAVLVDALTVNDAPSDVVVMVATLVEAGVAADVVVQGAIVSAAVIEAGTLADAVSALRAVGDGVAEALLASDATGLSAVFVATALESGTVTDIVLAAAVLGAALAEAATAQDVPDGASGSGTQVGEQLAGLDAVNWIDIAFTLLRRYAFPADSRTMSFPPDSRRFDFPADSRSHTFPADSRGYTFPGDTE